MNAGTHSPSIDRAASCRVIHQTVRHTQVCFTAGRCSAAHSRVRLPPAAWRRTEAGRQKQVGNSYSHRMRIRGWKIVPWQVQQERYCPKWNEQHRCMWMRMRILLITDTRPRRIQLNVFMCAGKYIFLSGSHLLFCYPGLRGKSLGCLRRESSFCYFWRLLQVSKSFTLCPF